MKRIHIALAASEFSEKTVSGLGTEISNQYGHITVLTGGKFSPAKHSITDFVVKPEYRGKGFGSTLIHEVIRRYKHDIGGQCSSKASVAVFYKAGFRIPDQPHHSLIDAMREFDEYGSLYMKLI